MNTPDTERSVVVFDLGGVLIDWNPRYVYRDMGGTEDEIDHFLTNVATSEWNGQMDAGRPFAEAVAERIEAFPDHETWLHAYHKRWEDMLGGPIDGSVAILDELRSTETPLYALTNWSAETFPKARALYDFLSWFDGIVVSGEVQKIKPNAEIFHHLIDDFGVQPSDAVFIDDSLPNVEAARKLGFYGIYFQGPDALRKELEGLGLLATSDR